LIGASTFTWFGRVLRDGLRGRKDTELTGLGLIGRVLHESEEFAGIVVKATTNRTGHGVESRPGLKDQVKSLMVFDLVRKIDELTRVRADVLDKAGFLVFRHDVVDVAFFGELLFRPGRTVREVDSDTATFTRKGHSGPHWVM